jgi:hypothetical protein
MPHCISNVMLEDIARFFRKPALPVKTHHRAPKKLYEYRASIRWGSYVLSATECSNQDPSWPLRDRRDPSPYFCAGVLGGGDAVGAGWVGTTMPGASGMSSTALIPSTQ